MLLIRILLVIFSPMAAVIADVLTPIPQLIPIRYDVQLQMPTSSDKDPLIPTFFGSARIEFQLVRPIHSNFPLGLKNFPSAGNGTLPATNRSAMNKTAERRLSFSPLDGIELKLHSLDLDSFENVTLRSATGHRYPVSENRSFHSFLINYGWLRWWTLWFDLERSLLFSPNRPCRLDATHWTSTAFKWRILKFEHWCPISLGGDHVHSRHILQRRRRTSGFGNRHISWSCSRSVPVLGQFSYENYHQTHDYSPSQHCKLRENLQFI